MEFFRWLILHLFSIDLFVFLFFFLCGTLQLNDKTTQFSRIIEYLQSHAPGAEKKEGKIIDLDGLSHYANILTPTVFSKVCFACQTGQFQRTPGRF
jgi:hypothetical protein